MEQSVHWHDGMFFLPQHMQATERYLSHQVALGQQWNEHHNWGIHAIEFDKDALANNHLIISTLQVRLRDGTLISIPEDGNLESFDLNELLIKAPAVTIVLAVPRLRLGTANVMSGSHGSGTEDTENDIHPPQTDADSPEARFRVEALEMEDENSGDNPQRIHFRWINFRLLPETGSLGGYETIPIVRVRRSEVQPGTVELDSSYIPPVLACDSWDVLRYDILEGCYDRINAKLSKLASEVVSRKINFDTKHYGSARRLHQLRVLNEVYTMLHTVTFGEGWHPRWVYGELRRAISQLAIFSVRRIVPDIPPYNHDDLGTCFYRAKVLLDTMLTDIADVTYQARPFIGEELRIQVSLNEEWLFPQWKRYMGVHSDLSPEDCIRLLTSERLLNMKIGSAMPRPGHGTRVDEIYARGEKGLQFSHMAQIPQSLPLEPGLIFFQISPESWPEEWKNVEKSRSLAIRVNENLIADQDLKGKHALTIHTDGQLIKIRLTLYLVDSDQETH